jgi:hypothetical protein
VLYTTGTTASNNSSMNLVDGREQPEGQHHPRCHPSGVGPGFRADGSFIGLWYWGPVAVRRNTLALLVEGAKPRIEDSDLQYA